MTNVQQPCATAEDNHMVVKMFILISQDWLLKLNYKLIVKMNRCCD